MDRLKCIAWIVYREGGRGFESELELESELGIRWITCMSVRRLEEMEHQLSFTESLQLPVGFVAYMPCTSYRIASPPHK